MGASRSKAVRHGTAPPSPILPRAKVWLEVDGEYVFGLGISNILKGVEQTGSIKEAAQIVGRSYRHVWSRIKAVERSLGILLVETRVGGEQPRRSQLTDAARQLVQEYDRLREKLFQMVDQQFAATVRSVVERGNGGAREGRRRLGR